MKYRAIVKNLEFNTITNFDVNKLEDLYWLYDTNEGLKYEIIKIYKFN